MNTRGIIRCFALFTLWRVMKIRTTKELNEIQISALQRTPTQDRSWEKLSIIATAAEEVLADPRYGRENFTLPIVVAHINEDWRSRGLDKPASIGVIYRYFSDPIDLMDFVWWWRRDTLYKPLDPKKGKKSKKAKKKAKSAKVS